MAKFVVGHELYILSVALDKYVLDMHIYMHMRTTLNIDNNLLEEAAKLTGTDEKTALVRLGLEALIARESAKRLADLGGTEPRLARIRRRRPGKAA